MNDENTSIHDFDINLICEYFSGMKRQGPGSPEMTLKALDFIGHLTEESQLADVGCGTGGQTMLLGQHSPAKITGIDLFPRFIELFNTQAAELGLHARVKGVVGDMAALPFGENELDVIWSEGAIYNIGFQRGLHEWQRLLKPGGYLAVTEASWFTAERPEEIHAYWKEAYPEIDTIPVKLAQLQEAGFIPTASFILPENCWTYHFYVPQIQAQAEFLKKYPGNKTAENLIANQRHEAEMYSRYKDFYGYVFYIGRKL